MKKIYTLAFLLFYMGDAFAQQQHFRIGSGIGFTPFEQKSAPNFEIQYEYRFTPKLSGFASIGLCEQSYFVGMIVNSIAPGGMSIFRQIEHTFSERYYYIDMGLKRRVFELSNFVEGKVILGHSMGRSVYVHPYSDRPLPLDGVMFDEAVRRFSSAMLLFGMEIMIHLHDQIGLSFSSYFRSSFIKRHAFRWRIDQDRFTLGTGYDGFSRFSTFMVQAGISF